MGNILGINAFVLDDSLPVLILWRIDDNQSLWKANRISSHIFVIILIIYSNCALMLQSSSLEEGSQIRDDSIRTVFQE